MSETAAPSTPGEPLSLERCKAPGFIFHATHNKNWEGIKKQGLVLGKTREEGQSSRIAIHYLADNGVVLCYQTIPASYLTFHTRSTHEKDPMGTVSSKQKAPGGSRMKEGPEPSSVQLEALLLQRDQMLRRTPPLSTLMTFGGLSRSKSWPSRQSPLAGAFLRKKEFLRCIRR